jgi:hypothetical protein
VSDEEPKWYYCLRHHTVEGEVGCRATDRIGPFATREEAEHAPEVVRRRNEEWDSKE